jgi:putative ABC transport system permease protein
MLGDPNDPSNQKGYFYVSNQESWKDESQSYLDMYSLVLGGIAGISLLVGGIGIMNIMLVTVTERTREIGIRRAIGAKRKAIVTQFLIESGVICGIGGIIGVGLGTILTLAGSQMLLKMQVLPSPIITLGSVLFAVALGIVFGLYPAIKASGLQPVVALRAD